MNSQKNWIIGIRREDKNRWERRAPLAPSHIKELIKKKIKVFIQPSALRCYSDEAYMEAGASIQKDLSEAQLILGVKEIAPKYLIPNKTYMFFSHTIKGQPASMPMLDEILENNIRLIDYEGITDSNNNRLVRFGKFAGMIDTIHYLGNRLLALGHSTPFLHIAQSYCYSSIDMARNSIKNLGEEIKNVGLPPALSPMIFVFTSNGHVSRGAQEIFKLLPHQMIDQKEMQDLVKHPEKASPFIVYGVVATTEDFTEPNDPNQKFDKKDYYAHPEKYHNTFFEKYAPYTSVIINCMYWDARYPRLITINQIRDLVEQGNSRLLAIGDISCDKGGSIEFLMKITSIDHPAFIYDPLTQEVHDDTTDHDFIYKDGILFIAVDNLPTEFPKEATNWFGDHLLPFLETIVKSDFNKPFSEQINDLPPEVYKAVITCHRELTPKYKYIMDIRKSREKTYKKILILGAGFVSGPVIEYLSRDTSNYITVADINVHLAENFLLTKPNCKAVLLDVNNKESLESLINKHDIVISLIPNIFNTSIAQSCLKLKKNLVTASYIPPEMKKMNQDVEREGLIFLNEIGLDPGIDHLEAKRVIDEVKEKGGKINSFVSWCGGLPSPEASGNPFAYKFSWSPRGFLNSSKSNARYLQDGQIIEIPGFHLFKNKQTVDIFPGFSLEGIPNRDSILYAKEYGIEKDIQTIFRGTLRYKGFCDLMEAIVDIGLLDEAPLSHLSPNSPPISWKEVLQILLNAKPNQKIQKILKNKLRVPNGFPSKGYDDDKIRKIINAFEWLGLFSDKLVSKKNTLIDSFCDLLQEKLKYENHEKDMILMHHIFEIKWPDGTEEIRNSTLVYHGSKHGMAMSVTVGIPVACATELILQGKISVKGVIAPMSPEIYKPILKSLALEGIRFVEKKYLKKLN